jgi:hypothetical protein
MGQSNRCRLRFFTPLSYWLSYNKILKLPNIG